MSKTPNFDAKVKALLDALEPGERTCALLGDKWELTQEEIDAYKKFNVPPSTVAPMTRLRQLAGFAGGISIWWKPHAETGKLLLSFVHPDNSFKVIGDKEWFGKDYLNGHTLNAGASFFDQFRTLAFSIPVGAMRDDGSNMGSIGIDLIDTQDSYMTFGSGDMKRIIYAYMAGTRSEDCVDLVNSSKSRESFALNWCGELFRCVYAFDSSECLNCSFIYDCTDCEFVFGATNKCHKKYLWFNEQLTKEEWERRRAEVDLSKWSVYKKYVEQFEQLMANACWPEHTNVGCEESTGSGLIRAVRCHECWWGLDSTDVYRCWATNKLQSSVGSVWAGWSSDMYQSVDMLYDQNCKFCVRVWRSVNVEYSMDCYECQNCFGCFGLRHKSFCLFNKQYSEEEYWAKLDEVKCAMLDSGEYGMFFPGDLSQSGFQFSMGKMYFDYTPEEYAAFQAPHFDPARGAVVMPTVMHPEDVIQLSTIPDALSEIDPATFVGKPIHDPEINRNFSVTPQEFAFYQSHQLPFPREHFLTRLKTLTRHTDTPVSFATTCAACNKPITAFVNQQFPNRQVHCRACYNTFLEANG